MGEYGRAVARYWWAVVIGVVVGGLVGTIQVVADADISPALWGVFVLGGLAVAQWLVWRDMRNERDATRRELEDLVAGVHGALKSQIDVQRVRALVPPDKCVALSFGIRFENTSLVRISARIVQASFTLNNPTSGAHECDVPIIKEPLDFSLTPSGGDRWWNTDLGSHVGWAPRQIPGWIDGNGRFTIEYGAEGSERRFRQTCDFRWRNHPTGETDYIHPSPTALRDEPI